MNDADDPTRISLKQMGGIPLPTRQGEVEIAKRIEPSVHAILAAILRPVRGAEEVARVQRAQPPIGEDGTSSTLGDMLDDPAASSPSKSRWTTASPCKSEALLATLTPRERRILRMRFGVGEKGEPTLDEIGRVFALGRERIRQMEAHALARLRHSTRSKHLRGLLDVRGHR